MSLWRRASGSVADGGSGVCHSVQMSSRHHVSFHNNLFGGLVDLKSGEQCSDPCFNGFVLVVFVANILPKTSSP